MDSVRSLPSRAEIIAEFGKRKPTEFGLFTTGVIKNTPQKTALTFDACGGGGHGDGYDAELIDTLTAFEVPATLFLNARWIKANPKIAADLAQIPLFELANHGWKHRPLTVRGQKAYGIAGSANAGEAYDEIVRGLEALAELTGTHSPFFRPGTAFSDDVGVAIAERLGVRIAAFSINADFGATAMAGTVNTNLRQAAKRDLVIGHFNRPEGATAEGLAKALPYLLDRGTEFATLSVATVGDR